MTTAPVYSRSVEAIRKELGENWFQELVQKASGQCYLCEDALDLTTSEVQKDHVDPRGPTEPHNLYLAHRNCNALKRDLPVNDAKLMIRFRKFCEAKKHEVTFDDVLDEYVQNPKRQSVRVEIDQEEAIINFSKRVQRRVPLMMDPTSGVKYCFTEVPVGWIHNDVDVQPRKIVWDHAWKLAQDFVTHPVHEPSACRLVWERHGMGRLLQFDGQHKTAAQIILGRTEIQTKIYMDPPLPLVRSLIVSIQNRIVKLPLETSIAITKLSDVYRDHWQQVGAETEFDFIKTYVSSQQAAAKKEMFAAHYKVILDNPNNHLVSFVQQRKARRGTYPLSMNDLTNFILKELVCQEPLTLKVGTQEDLRPREASNVVEVLNQLADELLLYNKWQFGPRPSGASSRDYLKAQRFFSPGSVKYWAPLLRQAIGYGLNLHLKPVSELSKPLLRFLSENESELVRQIIQRLCAHPVWEDRQDPQIDGKLRENRPATSKKLFEEAYKPPLTLPYLLGLPA